MEELIEMEREEAKTKKRRDKDCDDKK